MTLQPIRPLIASLLLTLLPASGIQAEESRIPKPRPLTVAELGRAGRMPTHGVAHVPKTRVSWPKIATGLAMVAAGAAMMAASPGKTGSLELKERAGGNIPCTVTNYVNNSSTGSRSTMCSNVTVYSHSPAYNGGASLVVTGGMVSLWGLVKRPAR